MEDIVKVERIIRKSIFCLATGYFTYKILNHVIYCKHYNLCFIKAFKRIKNICSQTKPQDTLRKDLQMSYNFFWMENTECRKHFITKLSCDEKFCSYSKLQYIIDFILTATLSVDLCMYLVTITDIANALVQAHKKGIMIRIIVEEEMTSSSESKIQLLIQAGIAVKSKVVSTLMHHKFCLVDAVDIEKCKLLTGSLNWTLQGLTGNWENIIIIHNTMAVKAFYAEFNEMWSYFDLKHKSLTTKKY